jgi:hypothetical protein
MSNCVLAENPLVEQHLSRILAVVRSQGATWHPGLRIVERDGMFALHCLEPAKAGTGDQPLVRMPRELLVPTAGVEWEESRDRLALAQIPDGLSAVQRELLELHVALYNAAGKISRLERRSPARLAAQRPVVLEALRGLRPDVEEDPRSLPEWFLTTRKCWVRPLTDADQEAGHSALFPILDLVNNHHAAAHFDWDDHGVSLAVSQPTGSSECFLHYGGRRDVLDLALHLGYVDRTTPFAHSAPVAVDVEGIGPLMVEALRSKPAHPLDPPRVRFGEEGIALSHLTCHRDHPERLCLVLALMTQGALRKQGQSVDAPSRGKAAAEVCRALAQANLKLLAALETAALPVADDWPAARLLVEASRLQGEILETVLLIARG